MIGVPVSEFNSPTLRLDKDCYNGVSIVGKNRDKYKYRQLDPDYDQINKELTLDGDPDDEGLTDAEIYDILYVDEYGRDVFDRIGMTILGGSGFVTSAYHYFFRPILSLSRRIIVKYTDAIKNLMLISVLLLGYELFVNRKCHEKIMCCCKKHKSHRQRGTDTVRDLAR